MFDFEKFPVYLEAEEFLRKLQPVFRNRNIRISLKDQLYRASTSVLLNIAEGAGKYSRRDKKNFYVTSRASAHGFACKLTFILLLHLLLNSIFTIG